MSSSWSCEIELKKIAEELHRQAYELESAASVLETLRDSKEMTDKINKAKKWATSWMERDK